MERRWDEGAKRAPRDGVSSVDKPEARPRRVPWPPTRRDGWYAVALAGAMWSVCQAEAPLHPSLGPSAAAWRSLWFGGLWAGLAVCTVLLKRHCLGRGGKAMVNGSDVVAEQKATHISWEQPGGGVSLSRALTDSLLLCVLQEPLSPPTLPHIEALLVRLKAVSQTLQRAEGLSGARSDREDPALMEEVKALNTYLQQRTRSLGGLVRAQGEFEAGVEGLLGGLELLWTQLVELHTRVTLTKARSRGPGDLAGAEAEAEGVSRLVGQYRTRLQVCQDQQRDTTQLLQELTWSHTHLSARLTDAWSSRESAWTELLLQANMEQFDHLQESFLSLDQQTSTFQAHLDGLERGTPDGEATGSASSSASSSSSSSSSCDAAAPIGPRPGEPTPASDAVSSPDGPRTLCERSALRLSSAFGQLRKSGRRK